MDPQGPLPPSGSTSPIKDETVNSRSSVSDNTRESITQSPPVQVMERHHDDFDISSRFSSPSSTWSSDSNESLFSIHLSSSYKHDQAHLSAPDDVEHSSQSDLDEPQKVVRWKTQVERLVDEGVNTHGQQMESSPLTDHKSSEPKNKVWWSICDCRSCNLPKWMSCSNCKPKTKGSSPPKEGNAPATKKPDQKKQCCYGCSGPWSCSCPCCLGEISTA